METKKILSGDNRFIILSLTILFMLSVFMCRTSNAAKRTISSVWPGMSIEEVESLLGPAEKIKSVERHIFFNSGRIIVENDKISDIRFDDARDEKSPLSESSTEHKEKADNQLQYLRIGNNSSRIEQIAGKPDKIVTGYDWHYNRGRHVIEFEGDRVSAVNKNLHTGLEKLDWIKLNFSPGALLIMNITIAFIMFGVALGIKPESFKMVIKEPKSLILGIFSQFLALPALTFILVYFIQPTPSVALGMILVAACPGGNISNFMSSVAKGNMALSISLTAFATIAAVFMTPVNFAFWGKLYSETSNMVIPIRIDFFEILRTVMLLLGLPVVLGILFSRKFPKITERIIEPVKKISMVIFLIFVFMALMGNWEFFKSYIHLIMFIVLAHNGLALLTGFSIGTLGKVSRADRRSLTIETGIQNSGLGLVLIFNPRLFDGLGGMAFIAAWWGIWHIISGLIMAYFWSKKPLPKEDYEPVNLKV